jgi:hypothetical protein
MNREHHRCTRPIAVPGTLAANGEKGANRFTFDGRIGGQELSSGGYRLTATPTANGRVGEPRAAAFSISR